MFLSFFLYRTLPVVISKLNTFESLIFNLTNGLFILFLSFGIKDLQKFLLYFHFFYNKYKCIFYKVILEYYLDTLAK